MTKFMTRQPVAASGEFTLGDDLTVRRLGFGAMRITGPGIWGQPTNYDEAIAVLRRAVELGTNLIDTADSYGPEVSEELIAEALYPYPKDLVIATKGGHLRGGPNMWSVDGRPESLRKALEGSLKRLKLDRIDVYQFHRPDPKVPFEESVGALAELRTEGKIRHAALSNVDADQLARAQKIVPIVSVQNSYNIGHRASEDLIDICAEQGIGFIPYFPLAMGELSKTGGKLDYIAHQHHATPGQIALAWLLHRSQAMLPIPGTSSLAHLEENIAAAEIKLTNEEFNALNTTH